MSKKLISRTDFALLAGVSGAAVSKACKAALEPAVSGRSIDLNHPAAVEYVAFRQAKNGNGPDPLYPQVLEYCSGVGRFTQTTIIRRFGVGIPRARRLLEEMKAAEIVPPVPRKARISRVMPVGVEPHVRGTQSAKDRAKSDVNTPLEEIFEVPDNIRVFLDMTLGVILEKFGTDERFRDFLAAALKMEGIQEKRLKSEERKGKLVNRGLVETGVIAEFNLAHIKIMQDGAKTIAAEVPAMLEAGSTEGEIEEYVSNVLGGFIKVAKKKIAGQLREL